MIITQADRGIVKIMNKFITMILFAVFLVGSGIVYQNFYRPAEIAPITPSGRVVEISMRTIANEWRFEPAVISARPGDRVLLKIFNEDTYDHGIAIEAFGVNKRLFPNRETIIDFVVSKPGTFSFYCSVPCGEGHYRHIGQFTESKVDTMSLSTIVDHEHLTLPQESSACHQELKGTLIVSNEST